MAVGRPSRNVAKVLNWFADGPPRSVVGPPPNVKLPEPSPVSWRFIAWRTMSPPNLKVCAPFVQVALAVYCNCQLSSM